jgi:asparagine N-glycosylation enzyme membrane subunit Stt3
MPWEFVGKSTNYTKVRVIHRLYTTLHKTILGFADIGSMEKFFWFFSVLPLIHVKFKKKKSTAEFHISKNILKMIK